jgi:hypothetical protein
VRWAGPSGDPGVKAAQYDNYVARLMKWLFASGVIGIVFLLGETLTILALGFRWFNAWTFAPITLCLVLMCLAVVAMPIIRYVQTSGR